MITAEDAAELEAWGGLALSGRAMPGVWSVRVGGVGYELSRKRADGRDGEVVTVKGRKMASVSITGRVWRRDQLAELLTAIERIVPQPKKGDATPVAIDSRATDAHRIDAVIIETVGGPDLADGVWTVTLEAFEWRPPPPPARGAGGSVTRTPTMQQATPTADSTQALLDQLAGITAQAKVAGALSSAGDAALAASEAVASAPGKLQQYLPPSLGGPEWGPE